MKRKIFRYIARLIGVKEGQEYPVWLLVIFYPVRFYALHYSGISFDFYTGVYVIDGFRFHESVLDILKELPDDSRLKIVKREDGTIFVERLFEEESFIVKRRGLDF